MCNKSKGTFLVSAFLWGVILLCPVPTSADTKDTPATSTNAVKPARALLAKDIRLDVLITLRRQECSLTEALDLLRDMTHVSLKINAGEEAASRRISLRYKAVGLKDVMDSLARLYSMVWQRRGNTYILHSKHKTNEEDTRPRSEAEATVYREGNAFLQQMKNLSPDVQQALYHNNEDTTHAPAHGLPFTALPPTLQQTVRAMFAASCESQEAAGLSVPFSEAELASSQVRIQGGSGGLSSKHLSLDVGNVSGSIGIGFYVSSNSNEENYQVVPPQTGSPIRDKPLLASEKETLQNDARLKRKITFRGSHLTFIEALQTLALQTQISFVADNWKTEQTSQSFSYVDVPIEDVLNRLGALYAFTRDTRPHVNYLAPGTQLIPQVGNKLRARPLERWVYSWGVHKSGILICRLVLDDEGGLSPANTSKFRQGQQQR